jgi:hypothetical protein
MHTIPAWLGASCTHLGRLVPTSGRRRGCGQPGTRVKCCRCVSHRMLGNATDANTPRGRSRRTPRRARPVIQMHAALAGHPGGVGAGGGNAADAAATASRAANAAGEPPLSAWRTIRAGANVLARSMRARARFRREEMRARKTLWLSRPCAHSDTRMHSGTQAPSRTTALVRDTTGSPAQRLDDA